MIRINLLGQKKAKTKRRAMPELTIGGSENAAFIAAIAGTLVLLAVAWWWQSSTVSRLRDTHAAVVAEQQQLAETAARVEQLEQRRVVVNQKLGVIVDLKKSQSGPVLLLDQVSRELPDSLWLTDMVMSPGGRVSIVGQALSNIAISDFGENLRLSSYFADTTIESTNDAGDSVRFQISTRFLPLTASPEAGSEVAAAGPAR